MKIFKKILPCVLFFLVCAGAVSFLVSRTKMENFTPAKQPVSETGSISDSPAEASPQWSCPPSYSQTVNDILQFDAKVTVSDSFTSGIFYKTKGFYQEYDSDAFYDLFLDNRTVAKEENYSLPDRNDVPQDCTAYWTADGDIICLYPTDAIYAAPEKDFYFYAFTDSITNRDMYNAQKYSLSNQLSFASRDTAIQKVLEVLDTIGYDPGSFSYQAYALDASTLNRESRRVYEWGFEEDEIAFQTEWDTQEEAYSLNLWQEVQGLPVWTARIDPVNLLDESMAPVTALYRENGFVSFRVSDILTFETTAEYDTLLPLKEIIHIISEKYDNIITDGRIVVTEMKLCALASHDGEGSCVLIPAWVCNYWQEFDNNSGQMILNAATGYEIYAN